MNKLLNRKNISRAFTFLLTLMLITSILGIGYIAEGTIVRRTAVFLNAFDYPIPIAGSPRMVSGIHHRLYINGNLRFDGVTTAETPINLTRMEMPPGTSVTIISTPPEGFRFHHYQIWRGRELHLIQNPQHPFSYTFTIQDYVQSIELIPLLVPDVPVSPIEVLLDGRAVQFDVPPMVVDSRTLVPLRAIFEALGAEVTWDAATQTVTGTRAGTTVVLPIGSTTPTVNGRPETIDVPGAIVNSRTLVPLRFVAESFGVTVNWNPETRTVTITS